MRKKIISIIGAVALMAVVLSLTAFAADETTTKVAADMTDYGLITVFIEKLKLFFMFIFDSIDKIYTTVAGWFA